MMLLRASETMINELHKQTLWALGFEVLYEPPYTISSKNYNGELEDFYIREAWVLGRYGLSLMGLNPFKPKTEADAWAQAPSLDELTKPLIKAMTNDATPFRVIIFVDGNDWVCHLRSNDEDVHIDVDDAPSLEYAIAAVFVAACDAGLIDGKAVVL